MRQHSATAIRIVFSCCGIYSAAVAYTQLLWHILSCCGIWLAALPIIRGLFEVIFKKELTTTGLWSCKEKVPALSYPIADHLPICRLCC